MSSIYTDQNVYINPICKIRFVRNDMYPMYIFQDHWSLFYCWNVQLK